MRGLLAWLRVLARRRRRTRLRDSASIGSTVASTSMLSQRVRAASRRRRRARSVSTRRSLPICATPSTCDSPGKRLLQRRGSAQSTRRVEPGRFAISSLRRAVRDEAAAIEDRKPMAAFGFVHVVRRDQQRRAGFGEIEQRVPEIAARLRIDGAGRLIEQQQLRFVQHGAGEREALSLAARHRAGQLIAADRRDGSAGTTRRCACCAIGAAESVHGGEELEILGNAEIVVEREFLRHVADRALDRFGLVAAD